MSPEPKVQTGRKEELASFRMAIKDKRLHAWFWQRIFAVSTLVQTEP